MRRVVGDLDDLHGLVRPLLHLGIRPLFLVAEGEIQGNRHDELDPLLRFSLHQVVDEVGCYNERNVAIRDRGLLRKDPEVP